MLPQTQSVWLFFKALTLTGYSLAAPSAILLLFSSSFESIKQYLFAYYFTNSILAIANFLLPKYIKKIKTTFSLFKIWKVGTGVRIKSWLNLNKALIPCKESLEKIHMLRFWLRQGYLHMFQHFFLNTLIWNSVCHLFELIILLFFLWLWEYILKVGAYVFSFEKSHQETRRKRGKSLTLKVNGTNMVLSNGGSNFLFNVHIKLQNKEFMHNWCCYTVNH